MSGLSTFSWIAIFALSAMIVNALGIWIVYKNKDFADRTKEYFMCFAAGVLITSPLIIAFPAAIDKTPYAGLAALAGFVFMYFSNKVIQYKTHQASVAFGVTALVGIGIHSFVDGIVYAVAFSVSSVVGILAGVGLVIHEFAEGVITFSLLIQGGFSKKRSALYAFLVASLTTPVGAFVVYPIVSRFTDSVLGLALGFVAGVLIYLSASHLLPEIKENERKHSSLAFIAGIALGIFMMFIES